MKRFCSLVFAVTLAGGVQAAWYWPFGSDDKDNAVPMRLSEMMEPASLLIDEASDLAADGKLQESIQKYREALTTLDRIEAENPDRAKKPEFASLRNKRAYVNAAIDSLLMSQVQQNAKAVAVSDTTELEKRLEAEKAERRGEKSAVASPPPQEELKPVVAPQPQEELKPAAVPQAEAKPAAKPVVESQPAAAPKPAAAPAGRPLSRRDQAMADIARGDYAAAELTIKAMLVERPNNALALNLRAMMEMTRGDFKAAERALDQAIMSNPRDYSSFYNMARLLLQNDASDKAAAKRYYDAGRTVGGPVDKDLEALLK